MILPLPGLTVHDLAVKPAEETVKVIITEADGTVTRRMECELCAKMFDVSRGEYELAGYICESCESKQLQW